MFNLNNYPSIAQHNFRFVKYIIIIFNVITINCNLVALY